MKVDYLSDLYFFFFGEGKLFFEEGILLFEVFVLLGEDVELILDLFETDFHLVLNADVFPHFLLCFLDCLFKNLVVFKVDACLSIPDCRDD